MKSQATLKGAFINLTMSKREELLNISKLKQLCDAFDVTSVVVSVDINDIDYMRLKKNLTVPIVKAENRDASL